MDEQMLEPSDGVATDELEELLGQNFASEEQIEIEGTVDPEPNNDFLAAETSSNRSDPSYPPQRPSQSLVNLPISPTKSHAAGFTSSSGGGRQVVIVRSAGGAAAGHGRVLNVPQSNNAHQHFRSGLSSFASHQTVRYAHQNVSHYHHRPTVRSPVKLHVYRPAGQQPKSSNQMLAHPTSSSNTVVLRADGSEPIDNKTSKIQFVRVVGSGGGNVTSGHRQFILNPSQHRGGPTLKSIAPQSTTSFGEHRDYKPPGGYLAALQTASKKKTAAPGLRKPCNCTKSGCLKLYCECFANGDFCRNCNCNNCRNTEECGAERTKAIRMSLERNPNAFQPKIGKGRSEVDRVHQKGCHCKKSSCLKNYCECYEARVSCTDKCKCQGCRNTEEDRQSKFRDKFGLSAASSLLHLASAATAEIEPSESPAPPVASASKESATEQKHLPWLYMTDEVVECTALCLVAQAEELERSGCIDETEMERAVLKEFGRCLQQIIDNANANA